MSTTPRRVEEIVKAVLELRPDERDAFLADICGDDGDLRHRVEVWVRVHTGSRPTPRPLPARPSPPPPPPPASSGWAGPVIAALVVLLAGALGLAGWAVLEARREAERADAVAAHNQAEAERLLQAQREFEQEAARERERLRLDHLRRRIDTLQTEEKFAEAEALLRQLLVQLEAQPAKPLDLAVQRVLLARNLLVQEKFTDAEPVLRDALKLIEEHQPDGWPLYDTRSLLGASLAGQKRHRDAEPFLLVGYEGLKQREAALPEAARDRLHDAGQRVLALYVAWGDKERADAWKRKLGL